MPYFRKALAQMELVRYDDALDTIQGFTEGVGVGSMANEEIYNLMKDTV